MSNGDVGGKIFEVGSTEYYVRGRGYIKSIADIENVPLKSQNGTPVYVKNVGTVHLGPDIGVQIPLFRLTLACEPILIWVGRAGLALPLPPN